MDDSRSAHSGTETPKRRKDGRGRPWKPRRSGLDGILWVLRTGAPWADLPERYPSYQTCHRRFQQWVRSGVMRGVLEALALALKIRGALDVEEAFIDGSFAPAKKGAPRLGRQNAARFSKIMAVADRHGLPVAVHVESATRYEVKLATSTLVQMVLPEAPQNLVGDNAYDSDKLDAELRQYGIELIALTVAIEENGLKIYAACDGIADVGRSRGCLPGCKTFAGWSCATSGMLRTFLECFTSVAA